MRSPGREALRLSLEPLKRGPLCLSVSTAIILSRRPGTTAVGRRTVLPSAVGRSDVLARPLASPLAAAVAVSERTEGAFRTVCGRVELLQAVGTGGAFVGTNGGQAGFSVGTSGRDGEGRTAGALRAVFGLSIPVSLLLVCGIVDVRPLCIFGFAKGGTGGTSKDALAAPTIRLLGVNAPDGRRRRVYVDLGRGIPLCGMERSSVIVYKRCIVILRGEWQRAFPRWEEKWDMHVDCILLKYRVTTLKR